MSLKHFAPTASPQEISQYVKEHGYAIIDDAASQELMDQLAEESRPFVDASAVGRDVYDGTFTRRTGSLIARCPAARKLVMDPLITGIAGDFLSHATQFQLLLTQIITIMPGETQQKLHRDQMGFDFFPFPRDYHPQCNTMWALTDFTIENGATHLCPDTSAMSDEDAEKVESIQAEMKRGSCLIYDGKILHGGGANDSDGVRQGVNITYAVGWIRQEENQYLACPQDIARTLDDDLLKMMGYQPGGFALGYVGDHLDPLAVLKGRDDKVKVIGEFAAENKEAEDFAKDI